jgi:hypothetical protein
MVQLGANSGLNAEVEPEAIRCNWLQLAATAAIGCNWVQRWFAPLSPALSPPGGERGDGRGPRVLCCNWLQFAASAATGCNWLQLAADDSHPSLRLSPRRAGREGREGTSGPLLQFAATGCNWLQLAASGATGCDGCDEIWADAQVSPTMYDWVQFAATGLTG